MNIAIIPNDYGVAHVTRSLEIAKALSLRNVSVTFFICTAKLNYLKDELIKYKIDHVFIPCLMPQEYDSKSGLQRIFRFILNSIKRFYAEKKLLSEVKIDAVVADFSFSSLLAAHECNLPSYLISNSYNLLVPIGDIQLKHSRDILLLPFKLIFFFFHTIFASLVIIFPVIILRPWKIFSHWWYCFRCHKIVPEPINNLEKKFNLNAHHVGWISVQHYEDLPFDFRKIKKLANGRKLVYLTTGGTGFGKKTFIEIMNLLKKQNYYVIGSTAGRFEIAEEDSDYYVRDFLPGGKICEHVALCVNHGGHGSLMQAITSGVYVIAYPQMTGQFVVSEKLLDGRNGKIVFSIEDLKNSIKNFGKMKKNKFHVNKTVESAVKAADIIVESLNLDKKELIK